MAITCLKIVVRNKILKLYFSTAFSRKNCVTYMYECDLRPSGRLKFEGSLAIFIA